MEKKDYEIYGDGLAGEHSPLPEMNDEHSQKRRREENEWYITSKENGNVQITNGPKRKREIGNIIWQCKNYY